MVAAAIEKDGKIFCAQRPEGKSLGGYWEFPGGKLEQGETPEEALIREIKEEFDSEIEIVSFINEASHEYDFGIVTMKTYRSKLHTGNLTLLDSVTNRGYGNAFFSIKRKTIIENDKKGTFIPICTKNLFLKYYSKNATDLQKWTEEDAERYKSAILETFEELKNGAKNEKQ